MVVPIFICGHSGRSNLLTEDNAKHWRGKAAEDLQWGTSRISAQWAVGGAEMRRMSHPKGRAKPAPRALSDL